MYKNIRFPLVIVAILSMAWYGCQPTTQPTGAVRLIADTLINDVVQHPAWAKDASIYEVNIRQYSPEGTINAVTRDLNRLEDLGVEILWLMPLSPIGELDRKGTVGNYYSLSDYTAVNPDFGTLNDVKRLVNQAHKRGMKVIIDWVADHTSRDHVWMKSHPDWYVLDSMGVAMTPFPDWTDLAELDYEVDSMRLAMIADMKYWITEAEIDGFRCDGASRVPTDFWETARAELDKIKPLFMLAEAEQEDHHNEAFNMSYAQQFHDLVNAVASGKVAPDSIHGYILHERERFPLDAYRMMFTTNHDANAWTGTVAERHGAAHKAFATLTFTAYGMPLIYSGQEKGLNKRLAFFEKDTIQGNDQELTSFYRTLLKAKRENTALFNGFAGGDYEPLITSEKESVFAFKREKGGSKVIVVLNFSDTKQPLSLVSPPAGRFVNIFDESDLAIYTEGRVKLEPYGYYVFTQK